jgi:zinc transport system substrate-binding protein
MRYIISFLLASAALPVAADVPRVVTDLPPVHSIATQVMAGVAEPVLLLDRGANAHSFQLRPSQAAALSRADLVVWIGPEMTPWLDRALDGLSEDAVRLGLLNAPETFTRRFGDAGGEDHDHDHDHAHDHGAAEQPGPETADTDHDDHGHDGVDPHAWLDPANAMAWADLMAAELGRLDPENAGTYSANAAKAKAGIAALDAEIAASLAPLHDRPFVVFHDAYGYFTDHYGLHPAGAIALGDATSPGAARLAALQASIGQSGTICLFPEAQHDPALVQQMAETSGARIGRALDPSGSSLELGAGNYAELLRNMAFALTECLNK